jgi:regulator of sigma E protease
MLFPGIGMEPFAPDFPPLLGAISEGAAADAAGLKSGDLILAADGQPIETWTDWVRYVSARPGERIDVLLERAGRQLRLAIEVGQTELGDGTVVGFIGTAPKVPDDLYDTYSADQRYGFWTAFRVAADRTWSMSLLTVRMVARMVTGEVSVKNISGPINIAQYAGYSASIGIASFLGFLAIVSLSLGILNLLPIPVLDGGQIVYQVLEAIKGQPLSERTQLVGQQIGIVFLMLMMSFAFYNDLNRFFS